MPTALRPAAAARSTSPGRRYEASNRCSISVYLFERLHVRVRVHWIITRWISAETPLPASDKGIDVNRSLNSPSRNQHNLVPPAYHFLLYDDRWLFPIAVDHALWTYYFAYDLSALPGIIGAARASDF